MVCCIYNLVQTRNRVFFIRLLRAVLLSLKNQHALISNAIIFAMHESRFQPIAQTRSVYVKTQMNGGRYFIHILPTRPLRADSSELKFGFGN